MAAIGSLGAVGLEATDALGERRRVGLERADVSAHHGGVLLAQRGDGEQRVAGEFLGEHPQPHLVDAAGSSRRRTGRCSRGTTSSVSSLRGHRQVVLTERARRHAADHRADGHAHHRRAHHLAEAGHHRHHRVGVGLAAALAGGALAQRHGQLGEQRSVGVEGALRPHATGDRGDLGEHGVEPGEVVHVQFEDAGQVGRAGCAPSGRRWVRWRRRWPRWTRELSGGVPVQRPLAGEQLGELAEHRHVGEGVVVGESSPDEAGRSPSAMAEAYGGTTG